MDLLKELLQEVVHHGASDLFITVGLRPSLKIDNTITALDSYALLTPADTRDIADRLLQDDRNKKDFIEHGEVDFSLSVPQVGRFRVNVFKQRGSCAVSLRRVFTGLPDTEKLGIPDAVMDLTSCQKGLILVTGPTGCGKSTTLAALINKINQERRCHILTLEDPIEYLHYHQKSIVNQREIGSDTRSYQRALRAALRQSPDVILIGEMRDHETISIALTAAETGHLVFSTLHTVGAAKTIDRIIDVFPPQQQQQIRIQVSTVLQAVVSQQLLPAQDGGLWPAFEVMLVNSAIRNMIRENKTPQIDGVIQMNAPQGMITMDASLISLVRRNLISRDDALLHAVNPETMQRYLP
ncbi:MAG: type IV pilus twitching motility protein PilT [Saccharofermentanales bacterium]|jgi:twitching motility protein PilT|nr:PilT/PilU family type 4a pilus ATPase [Clostridiaceae bacterium]